jgi:hypothetical protein
MAYRRHEKQAMSLFLRFAPVRSKWCSRDDLARRATVLCLSMAGRLRRFLRSATTSSLEAKIVFHSTRPWISG